MKKIAIHLALVVLFLCLCLFLVGMWLRAYTNHGQSLELSNYVGEQIDIASHDANDRDFQMIVLDSVFIVGKVGGEILSQNPMAGAKVKEDRKIYVTVTKSLADQIPVRRLPVLYGKDFERKRRELLQAFEIKTEVVDQKYDRGAPNHILEVRYNGETIVDRQSRKDQVMVDKGGTLEVVVSKNTGGALSLPDLTCKTYDEARFQLQTLNLKVGDLDVNPDVRDRNSAYVYRQYPSATGTVNMGDSITLYLQTELPENCDF